MEVQNVLVEGKTKRLYATDSDKYVLEFLDELPVANSKSKSNIKNKGAINKEIAAYLFDYLGSYNVPTHYVRSNDDKSIVVKKLNMIPLEMVVWNVATESLAKRLGLKDGEILETPVLELYLKNPKLKNPLINDYHAYTLGLCDRNEMSMIIRIGSKINAVFKSFFSRKQLMLAYFKLEFGKSSNQILVGDEISADNMVLWDLSDSENPDSKKYAITPENAAKVYPAILERITQ